MGWEYEDLFNNKIAGDGSFLEEPSFIQVGRMGYRRRTTVSGPRIDAEVGRPGSSLPGLPARCRR